MQRQKPNWAVYVGGPADGQRYIIGLNVTSGTTTYTTPGGRAGMLKVHVYEVTKGTKARFKKHDRGVFVATAHAGKEA